MRAAPDRFLPTLKAIELMMSMAAVCLVLYLPIHHAGSYARPTPTLRATNPDTSRDQQ